MHRRLMNIQTLADYIDASTSMVKKLVREQKLPPPSHNDPRFVRWDRAQVDAWLDQVKNPSAGPEFHPDSVEAHKAELKRRFGTCVSPTSRNDA